jgi:MMPL family protein
MLGLAVGVDYALFIVSRHRQHLLDGVDGWGSSSCGRRHGPARRREGCGGAARDAPPAPVRADLGQVTRTGAAGRPWAEVRAPQARRSLPQCPAGPGTNRAWADGRRFLRRTGVQTRSHGAAQERCGYVCRRPGRGGAGLPEATDSDGTCGACVPTGAARTHYGRGGVDQGTAVHGLRRDTRNATSAPGQ